METGTIKCAKFIFKAHKYQLVQLDIEFKPTDDKFKSGLMKTSFKVFLDGKFIGYVPLDMLGIVPEATKGIPTGNNQVILKTKKPNNFDQIPFAKDMKTTKFLGKIFKQDHMKEINIDSNHVSLIRDKRTIKRERRKNKK